jgi:hypothetical protein
MNSGLRFLPAIYTFTIVINFAGILESAPPLLYFDRIPWWGKIVFALGVAVIVYIVVMFIVVPKLRKKMLKTLNLANAKLEADKLNGATYTDENNLKMEPLNSKTKEQNNISTQVDHLALVYNVNEVEKKTTSFEEEFKDENNDIVNNNATKSHTITHHTVDGAKLISNLKAKRKRTRLDSAPTNNSSDSEFNDDVNLTLSGYLHTYHGHHNRFNILSKNINKSSTNQSNPSVSSNPQKASLLKRLFIQDEFVEEKPEDSAKEVANNEANDNDSNKVGRFTKEPAKIESRKIKFEST